MEENMKIFYFNQIEYDGIIIFLSIGSSEGIREERLPLLDNYFRNILGQTTQTHCQRSTRQRLIN